MENWHIKQKDQVMTSSVPCPSMEDYLKKKAKHMQPDQPDQHNNHKYIGAIK